MLHTYQLKQLDIFRNDVLNQVKKGNYAKGAYNMASLTGWLLASGVAVNSARDYVMTGETKDLSEYFLDNVGQIFLVNRYLMDKGFREGIGEFFWGGVKPAIFSIANDASKDLRDIYGDVFEEEDKTEDGFRSTRYIPGIGRIYHDLSGRGANKREKKSNSTWQ